MIDDKTQHDRVQQYWDAYAASARVEPTNFVVVRFGDSSDLADELATQVVTGHKRATTSLLRDFTHRGKTMPKPGDISVVVDGKDSPRCIIRTRQVDVKPFRDVDVLYAWDEGGGDRSLEWWRAAHARYFKRQGVCEGFELDDGIVVVLERFEVVWPLER